METITGIKIEINIECETEDEILAHLSVIRQTIKKHLRKNPEITQPVRFTDENCYGEHVVEIGLIKS